MSSKQNNYFKFPDLWDKLLNSKPWEEQKWSETDELKHKENEIKKQKEMIDNYRLENFHFVRKEKMNKIDRLTKIQSLVDHLFTQLYTNIYWGDHIETIGFEIFEEDFPCPFNDQTELDYLYDQCQNSCDFDRLDFVSTPISSVLFETFGNWGETISGFHPNIKMRPEESFTIQSIIVFEQPKIRNVELWFKLFSTSAENAEKCLFLKFKIPLKLWKSMFRPIYSEIRSYFNGLEILFENHVENNEEKQYDDTFWNTFNQEIKDQFLQKIFLFYRQVIDPLIIEELKEMIPTFNRKVILGEISSGSGSLALSIIEQPELNEYILKYIMFERNNDLVEFSRKKLSEYKNIVEIIEKDIEKENFMVDLLPNNDNNRKIDIWISSGSVLSQGVGSRKGALFVFQQMYESLSRGGFIIITGWENSWLKTRDFLKYKDIEILNNTMPTLEAHTFLFAPVASHYLDFFVLRKK